VAEFIHQAVTDGVEIVCQCEYGQSRSAGLGAAILEYYERRGIDIFRDYRYYPNQLIFNKAYEAMVQYAGEK
jgi:protein-tyrosine phosphatase